ncbi:hypothetical protein GGS24DRAFT_442942 [Hypoxylon argillaceum]|nr:hypothetical protein GGS24DRAFT_442942 [Hypoxylon argillaceum]
MEFSSLPHTVLVFPYFLFPICAVCRLPRYVEIRGLLNVFVRPHSNTLWSNPPVQYSVQTIQTEGSDADQAGLSRGNPRSNSITSFTP